MKKINKKAVVFTLVLSLLLVPVISYIQKNASEAGVTKTFSKSNPIEELLSNYSFVVRGDAFAGHTTGAILVGGEFSNLPYTGVGDVAVTPSYVKTIKSMNSLYTRSYENKYKDTFPKFQEAIKRRDYLSMKKECTANNSRRDTIRQWLVKSAMLANRNLSETEIRKKLSAGIAKDFYLSPTRESRLWCEIDKCTKENCTWKKLQIAQVRQSSSVQKV